jgi:hypothetical protein
VAIIDISGHHLPALSLAIRFEALKLGFQGVPFLAWSSVETRV